MDSDLRKARLLKRKAKLEEDLAKVMRQLEELDEVIAEEEIRNRPGAEVIDIESGPGGSYVLQKVKCGCTTCHCMKGGELHGPYWYFFRKVNGETKSKYIGKELKRG